MKITLCPLCLSKFVEGNCPNGCWDDVHEMAEEIERQFEPMRKELEEVALWEPNVQEWRR